MAFAGFVRAIHAVSVELTGIDSLHPDVPYIAGAVAHWIQIDYPGRLCVFGMVEQLESNAAGVAAEDGEIDPSCRFLGSQRQRQSPPEHQRARQISAIYSVQLALGRLSSSLP